MFHFTLEQGHSAVTLIATAGVALVGTWWLYRSIAREVSPKRRRGLLALRLLALTFLLMLLFRPSVSFPTERSERRTIVFLLDSSASMSVTDDTSGTTRWDRLRPKAAEWYKQLHREFRVELMSFADRAVSVADPAALEAVQPNGQATSLTRAVQAAAQKAARKDFEAIVICTDGIHNAVGDPAQAARKLGLTVHTVGVGASRRNAPSYRDVQLAAFECPPQLFLNNQARLNANVESIGLAGRVVKVMLEEDGKVLDQVELPLSSGPDPQPVQFQFVPTTKGRHKYTVRIPVQTDEAIPQNNQRSTVTQVVDARIRVLYVEGALRAEYGALVERFFSKDPDLEFCSLVQTRRNVFLQRTNIAGLKLDTIPSEPAVLEKFNVFVIGDLDSNFLKPAQMEMLTQRVRDGAGLVMLGGYNGLGPGGYGGTALDAVLPVKLGERTVGQINEQFLPVLSTEGRNHPIFANIARFFPSVKADPEIAGLPPLQGCVKVAGARAGALVLAYRPGDDKLPVLAVQPVGKGRTAVFTGDTTRNWQQVTRALDQESPFTRFWGQLLRWLANRTDVILGEDNLVARTDKTYYEPDSPITITALVRNKEGEGNPQAQVQARIKLAGGKVETVKLSPSAATAGSFQALFEPRSAGTVEIVVEAKVGAKTLTAEAIAIEVGRPNLEFDRLDLDDRLLTKIAEATGGRYVHLSNADRLIETLEHTEQRRRIVLEQPLYFPVAYWMLFVALLGSEWFLRKRFQLR